MYSDVMMDATAAVRTGLELYLCRLNAGGTVQIRRMVIQE